MSETRKDFTLEIDTWSKRKEQKKNQDQMTRGEGNGASSNQRENEKIECGFFYLQRKCKNRTWKGQERKAFLENDFVIAQATNQLNLQIRQFLECQLLKLLSVVPSTNYQR